MNPSTAYHPQTNGQMEQINQEIEQYLHLFINHQQNNWFEWLSATKFSYNNKIKTSTGFSPFYVNYRQHLYKGTNPKKTVKSQSAVEFADQWKTIWEEMNATLQLASEQMKMYYDRKHSTT
jgi:hypothetical protein